jgi:flavin reductase (DIM6/NTAB) family NADH-FMN oxidoreductase RutF
MHGPTEYDLMQTDDADKLFPLTTDRSIWARFFGVFPLVIVRSKEQDGRYNLAPKHLAMPLGWENHYCFVCSPGHTTYHSVRRHGVFTVSYPRPTEHCWRAWRRLPRCEDLSNPN